MISDIVTVCSQGTPNRNLLWGPELSVQKILKMELPHDTVIPLLRLYLDKSKNTDLKEYMGGEGGGETGGY